MINEHDLWAEVAIYDDHRAYELEYDDTVDFSEGKSSKCGPGDTGKVRASERPGKKFKVCTSEGRIVHFGASGYSIQGNTDGGKRGDSYCARSAGISTNGPWSPNALSRWTWNCRGSKAVGKPRGVGDVYRP